MTKEELYQQFLSELDRSLIVDDKTREYWLQNYKTLPPPVVEYFLHELKTEDAKMDKLVAAGIDADPGLGEQIVQKGKEAKRQLAHFQERESREEENPEEFLKSNL